MDPSIVTRTDGSGARSAQVVSATLRPVANSTTELHVNQRPRGNLGAFLLVFDDEAKERQGTRTDIVANLPQSSKGRSRDKAGESVAVSGNQQKPAASTWQYPAKPSSLKERASWRAVYRVIPNYRISTPSIASWLALSYAEQCEKSGFLC